jgi:hypothetical protein
LLADRQLGRGWHRHMWDEAAERDSHRSEAALPPPRASVEASVAKA